MNALLSCHDNRLLYEQNAVNDIPDCMGQMPSLAIMRTASAQFFDRSLNHGPFIFCLTDLHASNILVDQDWNIKCHIDLEWAAFLAAEFMQAPHWLTNQAVDMIDRDSYVLREEFMRIFEGAEAEAEAEEKNQQMRQSSMQYSSIMKKGWETGTCWYILALQSPTGLNTLFYNHIQPYYAKKHADDGNFYAITCLYWARNAPAIIKRKVDEKKEYDERLRQAFAES